MSHYSAVVITGELPYPARTPVQIRTWELMRRMADRHRITWIVHTTVPSGLRRDAIEACRDADIRLLFAANATELCDRLIHCQEAGLLDLLYCESAAGMSVSKPLTERGGAVPPMVFAAHPILASSSRCSMTYSATRFVARTKSEAQYLRDRIENREVDLVPNGVDVSRYRPQRDVERSRTGFLYVGTLDHSNHQSDVTYLLDAILPQVRRERPEAELTIVGRNPPGWLKDRIRREPNVTLQADLTDLRPVYHTSAALIAPDRVRGGSQLSLLEALATATPVIATEAACEGLPLEPDRYIDPVLSERQLVNRVLHVMDDPESARDRAEDARRAIVHHCDWDYQVEKLAESWHAAVLEVATTAMEDD